MDNPSNLARLSQVAGQTKQQQGTGYTNLNKLVGASAGNQLGQKVAGNVQSQIGNVQNQLGQQQQQFQTESEKNKVGSEADIAKRNEVINRFAPASGSDVGSGRSDATQTPASTPSSGVAAPSEQDVTAFQRFTSGNYAGPQGLQDTSALQTSANQLKNQVSNFSPSGTQELLRRSVGGNRYTQGQQRLDTLLMDKSALTPVQRQASTLGQQIQRADVAASGQAELNKNQAAQFAQETQDKLNAGLTGIDTSIQGSLADAQRAEGDRQAKIAAIQAFQQDASKRGGASEYGQSDALKTLLASQGADTSQLSQLFGTTNAQDIASKYDPSISQAQSFQNSFWGTANNSKVDALRNAGIPESEIQRILGENTTYGGGISGDAKHVNWSGFATAGRGLLGNKVSGIQSAKSNDLSTLGGEAGKALASGGQEQFYKDLATRLSNSAGAKNLTEQGISSDAQRASYEALNKLLGKTQDQSKYQTFAKKIDPFTGKEIADTSHYEAGKYNLV